MTEMGAHVDQDYFFEGTEKLLEVWFFSSDPSKGGGSLRNVPRDEWQKLLDIAHCQIVSARSNALMDSYVLSESSLFVTDRRFLLKTCGSTSLLNAVQPLLSLAERFAGLDCVANVYYSRRNFKRPELQPIPHRSFDEEVEHLDTLFENGAGYCMGRLNRDRWYLYTLNPAPVDPIRRPDQTLEILMSDLDPDVMSIFTTETCTTGKEATKLSGIDKLVPLGTVIDDKLFEPCGYSMNGIIGDTDQYVTIHITPEPGFSYVSYETNVAQSGYVDLIRRILYCFRPARFLMTVIASKISAEGQVTQKELCEKEAWEKEIPGFRRKDLQQLSVPDTAVIYAHYEKIV